MLQSMGLQKVDHDLVTEQQHFFPSLAKPVFPEVGGKLFLQLNTRESYRVIFIAMLHEKPVSLNTLQLLSIQYEMLSV